MPSHAKAIIAEPAGGWTRQFYNRQLAQYVIDRGSASRTATLHPETMTALGFNTTWIDALEIDTSRGPLLVSSSDYARDIITLYE